MSLWRRDMDRERLCRMLDARCRMPDAGGSGPDAGCPTMPGPGMPACKTFNHPAKLQVVYSGCEGVCPPGKANIRLSQVESSIGADGRRRGRRRRRRDAMDTPAWVIQMLKDLTSEGKNKHIAAGRAHQPSGPSVHGAADEAVEGDARHSPGLARIQHGARWRGWASAQQRRVRRAGGLPVGAIGGE